MYFLKIALIGIQKTHVQDLNMERDTVHVCEKRPVCRKRPEYEYVVPVT